MYLMFYSNEAASFCNKKSITTVGGKCNFNQTKYQNNNNNNENNNKSDYHMIKFHIK